MNWTIGKWSDAKTHAKFCLPDKKESRSCIGLWQAMKSGSIFRILNARNLGLIPRNHQHLLQDQIASDGRQCCAFGGIRRVSSTTSFWAKDMTSWFSSMTTHHRTRQQWSKIIWKHSTGKCPIPLTHQTWYLLTITFSSMGYALAERDSYEDIRKWLDEWFASKDEEFFWRGIHKLPERWEKLPERWEKFS